MSGDAALLAGMGFGMILGPILRTVLRRPAIKPHRTIDVHLIEEAEAGNHEAVRIMARACVETLTRIEDTDDGAAWLAGIMARIAEGQTPDEAFGWGREGAQPQNLAFIQWTLARWVKTLRDEHGVKPLPKAFDIVADATGKSGADGGTIHQAWKKYGRVEIPIDIFPIPEQVLRRAAEIDERMEKAIARLFR